MPQSNILPYHEPDERWSIFGINDYKSYVDKYVIQSKFIPSVPSDVIDEYKSAEYLMAHSYYYYPLYDEVANKLFRVTEMAIKLRCKQLQISKHFTDKTGKKRDKDLNRFINDLEKKQPGKELKRVLDVVRKLRNGHMHPEQSTLYGPVFLNSIYQIVNLINELFMEEKHFVEKNKLLEQAENELSIFTNGLFVLETGGNNFLVQGAKSLAFEKIKGEWISFCVAHPVLLKFTKMIEQKRYDPPIFFTLKEYSSGKEKISGKDMNGLVLNLYKNTKPVNQAVFEKFNLEQNAVTSSELDFYKSFINQEMSLELVKFKYTNCWE